MLREKHFWETFTSDEVLALKNTVKKDIERMHSAAVNLPSPRVHRLGWLCPRCDAINGPDVIQCTCKAEVLDGGVSTRQVHNYSPYFAPPDLSNDPDKFWKGWME